MGKQWKQWKALFWGAPRSLQLVTAVMKLKDFCSLEQELWPTQTACWTAETLLTKEHLVKAMVFPVVMYGCESLTLKKAECWRIDAWFWRRLLRVPWTARGLNHSFLKEFSPEYSWKDWCWSWNSNTLAISCEELTHWKRLWCWDGLGAGAEGDDRGWDGWMVSLTRWTWVWVNSGSWWWTGRPGVLRFMESQRVGHDWATELNWSRVTIYSLNVLLFLFGTSLLFHVQF